MNEQRSVQSEMLRVAITEQSKALFLAYAKDAGNWGGTPLVDTNGNVSIGTAQEDRGNLTQIKRAGLVRTFKSPDGGQFLEFTDAGRAYAASLGVQL